MKKLGRFLYKQEKKISLPPGNPVFIGERKVKKARIKIIDYNETQVQEREAKTIEECFPFKETPTTTWINMDGIHEVDIIEKIGNKGRAGQFNTWRKLCYFVSGERRRYF